MKLKYRIVLLIILSLLTLSFSERIKKDNTIQSRKIESNINGKGYELEFTFTTGESHNHPTFAIWIEDTEGNYIQPLFVTKAFSKGIYTYGDQVNNKWESGSRRYKAALPYFTNKRAQTLPPENDPLPSMNHPIADAYSGATPTANFILCTKSNDKKLTKFKILLEVNQTWDFNNYWHNAKYPENKDYTASCQPSLIYSVDINTSGLMNHYSLNPIGHGHYSGDNGFLYTDISTITSAKEIFTQINLTINAK